MELYKFVNKTRRKVMLTTDKDGGNLPGQAKDWIYEKTIEVTLGGPERVGFPNEQILESIEKIGFFPPEPLA